MLILNQKQAGNTLKGHTQFSCFQFQLLLLSQPNTQHLGARNPTTKSSLAEVINCVSKHTNKSTIYTFFPGSAQIPRPRRASGHVRLIGAEQNCSNSEGNQEPIPAAAWRRAPGACWPASSAPPSAPIDYGGLDWGSDSGASWGGRVTTRSDARDGGREPAGSS